MFKSKNTKLSWLAMFSLTGFICLLFSSPVSAVDPPRCYDYTGEMPVACDEAFKESLKRDKCYKEIRGGPSGVLQGYDEISCEPPRCYDHSGKTPVACNQSFKASLKPRKCYVEIRGGPSGTLQGYKETSCINPELGETEEEYARRSGNFKADCDEPALTKQNCGIVAYLLDFINILSALVGITAVIMLVVWGIQYTVSRDNPQMVASARLRILNTVLAVVGYLFIYAFLQWLVPGGIF